MNSLELFSGLFLVDDMQTPPSSKVAKIVFFVPKDAQCSETYAETILLFFFPILSFNKIVILSFWNLERFFDQSFRRKM